MSADVRDTTGRHRVTITGSQPVGASVLYAYRVPEPAAFAQAALTVALDDAGVSVAAAGGVAIQRRAAVGFVRAGKSRGGARLAAAL